MAELLLAVSLLALAGVGAYLGRRMLALKELEVRERVESAAQRQQREPVVPIPAALEIIAFGESEPWAREDVRNAMVEAYKERGSWESVAAMMTR